MNKIPHICGNSMQITYVDCYAFSLETMMGENLIGADTASDALGTKGVRAFNSGNIISCGKGTCAEVLVPFHAVKKFESHVITEAEGDREYPTPYSRCIKTELYAPKASECEEHPSCFSFEFRPREIPGRERRDLEVVIVNNCDTDFEHSTACHYGLKQIVLDTECEEDVYGLTATIPYYAALYFIPTAEEIAQGYKDVEFTITATDGNGNIVSDSASYRYVL